MKERKLLIEDATGRVSWDIYRVPLPDVVFETETTPHGAVRCVARELALIAPPRGGLTTSRAVDPVPKGASAPR